MQGIAIRISEEKSNKEYIRKYCLPPPGYPLTFRKFLKQINKSNI